jgi:tetratricopeptide (TPR) repeat protein
VLDGNIQTTRDRIRVSVKLLRVSDSKQLWSGQFDQKLTDIFDVQDSIAQRVATALNITLGRSADKPFTESVEAYQLYMRGNFHARRLILSEIEKGIVYYEEALKLDPQFALVYAELANANRALVLTSDYPAAEYMPKAKAAALKALEVDNTLAEAWSSLAISDFWYDWDFRAAEAHHLRALQLDPHSSHAHIMYGHLLSNLGKHDEALEQIRLARERDPVSLLINAIEGQVLFFAGQTDEAERVLNRTIDMEPNFWLAHLFITRVHLRKERYDEAIASARRAADLSGGNAEALSTIGFAYARSGRAEEARKILAELRERSKSRHVPSYTLAQIHAGLDDRQTALALLERAFQEKDALMVFLKVEPGWDDLRSEPRFVELMRRMRFE